MKRIVQVEPIPSPMLSGTGDAGSRPGHDSGKRGKVLIAACAGSLLLLLLLAVRDPGLPVVSSALATPSPLAQMDPTAVTAATTAPSMLAPASVVGQTRTEPDRQLLAPGRPVSVPTPGQSFAPAVAPARAGITTDDYINTRTGPGTDYRIIAQLPTKTRVQIVAEQDGWYHIATPWGLEGWALAGFFTLVPDLSSEQPLSIGSASTVGVANMRAGPGPGYPIARKLDDGTVVDVLTIQGAWYEVRSPLGDVGWVSAEYVPLDWIPEVYGGGSASLSSISSDVVQIAQKYLGARYIWGGSDPSGFDCSGLAWYVYHKLGVVLPVGSAQQFSSAYGRYIGSMPALAPGDLVFFERTTEETGITHMGIYAGNNVMIAARSERLGVRYVSLEDPFWSSRFVGGIRPYR
ncbi:MAG: SH3 domain-containing protein [Chloroflexota bacterium]